MVNYHPPIPTLILTLIHLFFFFRSVVCLSVIHLTIQFVHSFSFLHAFIHPTFYNSFTILIWFQVRISLFLLLCSTALTTSQRCNNNQPLSQPSSNVCMLGRYFIEHGKVTNCPIFTPRIFQRTSNVQKYPYGNKICRWGMFITEDPDRIPRVIGEARCSPQCSQVACKKVHYTFTYLKFKKCDSKGNAVWEEERLRVPIAYYLELW